MDVWDVDVSGMSNPEVLDLLRGFSCFRQKHIHGAAFRARDLVDATSVRNPIRLIEIVLARSTIILPFRWKQTGHGRWQSIERFFVHAAGRGNTYPAFWRTRCARVSTVQNQEVMCFSPLFWRQQSFDLAFDFVGCIGFLSYQTQTIGYSKDMRVYRESRHIEGHRCDDLGCFTSDTWETHQFVHSLRDFTFVLIDQKIGRSDEVFRFVVRVRNGLDQREDIFRADLRHVVHRWKPLEQGWGYLIHPRIGTLRRQDDGDQQLPVILVFQFGFGRRDDFPQRIKCTLGTTSSTHQVEWACT